MDSNNTLRICKSYKERFDKLTTLMEYPEFNVDYNFSKKYLKELSDIKPIVDLYNTYLEFSDEKDRDLIIQDINKELLKGRHDEYDGIVIEVSSKDKEAANFVLTSYFNYFKANEYNVDLQKDKLIVFGASIYSLYKVETGTHIYLNHKEAQVQVLVLPYKDIDSYTVSLRDLKVDYFHSSGAGGQNINKVETAVRMTHKETGIVVQCQDERSQLQNKQRALELISKKVQDYYAKKINDDISKIRKDKKLLQATVRVYDLTKNELFETRTQKKYNISDVFMDKLSEIDSEILVNGIK